MAEANKRPQLTKVMAKGIAKFPYLTKPDTKFKAEGVYVTEVVISKSENADLLATIEKAVDASFKEARAELTKKTKEGTGADKAKAKKALEELKKVSPVRPVYDDDGNEDADLVSLKFSMYAQFKDKKTGKVKKLSPAIVDAKGKKWPEDLDIWGGSIIKVGGKIKPFFVKDGAGAKLLLEAVKVIELKTGGGDAIAGYGFDEGEEGTDTSDHVPSKASADPDEEPSGDPTEDSDDDVDF